MNHTAHYTAHGVDCTNDLCNVFVVENYFACETILLCNEFLSAVYNTYRSAAKKICLKVFN